MQPFGQDIACQPSCSIGESTKLQKKGRNRSSTNIKSAFASTYADLYREGAVDAATAKGILERKWLLPCAKVSTSMS